MLIRIQIFFVCLILGLLISCQSPAPKEVEHSAYDIPTTDTSIGSIAEPIAIKTIDSAKIKRLKPLFKIKKDEFSKSTWYIPKSAPGYVNYNALYLYFEEDLDGKASNLRLQFQYAADDWLFIEQIVFLIDDQTYTYKTPEVSRDNGEGGIWEWFDTPVNYSNEDIIKALRNAKSAKMKLNGNEYYKVKQITSGQLKSIKEVLDLFEAKGGHL